MKNFLIYIVLLTLIGCGYIDDDGIIFEEQIVGKFYIRQQARSEQIGLDYVEDLQRGTGVVEDCNKLIYDSIRKEIFVERRLWDSASSYYLINIIDENAEKSLGAFKKKEIFEKTFFNKIDTCKHCLIWDMTVKRRIDKTKTEQQ
ncbi:MAG TPA: hypothetical protein VK173_03965 [Lacibacter sp.]|nr:hypothetical protein [Lacibacter sp.]